MPKIVDYAAQKQMIGEAAWRVIQREGVENASVRKIAKEAGISSGTLQHYFKTQPQLLEFTMKLVVERVEQRFAVLNEQIIEITLCSAIDVLLNFVPVNEEQELEAEVWLALTVKALHDPTLHEISKQTYQSIYETLLAMLQQLSKLGLIKQELELNMEAQKLHMLLDALTLHRMVNPETITVQEMSSLLTQHMAGLTSD